MVSSLLPHITVLSEYSGLTTYDTLYGYVRPCGRTVLVLREPNKCDPRGRPLELTDWFGLSLGEVVGTGILHVDAGPKEGLHKKMYAASFGETVRYSRVRLRKLTAAELAAATASPYAAAHMPPPRVLRGFGDPVPPGTAEHECDRCYWQ